VVFADFRKLLDKKDIRFMLTCIPAVSIIILGYFLNIIGLVSVVLWPTLGLAALFGTTWMRKKYSIKFDYYFRAFFHMLCGIVIVFVGFYSKDIVMLLAASMFSIFGLNSILERLNIQTAFSFTKEQRDKKTSHYVSGLYWITSSLFVLVLFPMYVALTSILVLAISDPTAKLIGGSVGRKSNPLNMRKTVEGSITCFLTSFVIVYVFFDVYAALLAAFFVALVEALQKRIDDNLALPPVVSLAVYARYLF